MKAISLWQPWASAMNLGFKKNETRHWYTSYRGPLLIHAAKKKIKRLEWPDEILTFFENGLGLTPDALPYGTLLCKVQLIDCVRITEANRPGENTIEGMFGNYAPGRFMWITNNAQTFKPIPYRGMQGLFDVPDEVVREALK